jgi:2-dehydropantoate 2-reductase
VAHGKRIHLPEDAVDRAVAFLEKMPPDATASMQRDIIEGRPSELEAQNGAVVRMGKAVGVDTPLHRFIYYSLLPMEAAARTPR